MNRKSTAQRWGWLIASSVVFALLFVGLSHADRLPGPAGEAIRQNLVSGQDPTAMFYTELNNWLVLKQQVHKVIETNKSNSPY